MELIEVTCANYKEVRALHMEVYGWAPSEKKFEGKYLDAKRQLKAIGFLAINDEGKAVAYYGVFLCRVMVAGRLHIAGQSGDTMTHSEYQGRGLFTLLAKKTYSLARDRGVSFIFGIPNSNSYPGFKKKLDWVFPRKMIKAQRMVPTIPLGFVEHALSAYQKFLLKVLGAKSFTHDALGARFSPNADQVTDILVENRCFDGHRYFSMKKGDAFVVFRLDKLSISIGVANLGSKDEWDSIYSKLVLLCFLSGKPILRTYLTENCEEYQFVASRLSLSESLWLGVLCFDDSIDISSLKVRFYDYDTF